MLSLDAPSGQRRHYSAGCGGTMAAPKWADLINRENTAGMPTDWAALINTAVGPTAEVLLDSSDGSLVDLRDLIARISKERISDLPITIVGNDAMAPYGLHEDF
jgi:hypothetical protein